MPVLLILGNKMPREIKSEESDIEIASSFDGRHRMQFSEKSHRYKWLCSCHAKMSAVGVTTFCKSGIRTSQGLISWQKEQALTSLFSNLTSIGEEGYCPRESFWPVHEETRIELFKEAKAADRIKSQEAADIGTCIHEYCFLYETNGDLLKLEAQINRFPDETRKMVVNGINKFKSWRLLNPDKITAVENIIASPTHLFCGKFDKLAIRNGVLILSDYKSSKSIYLDQFIQLAAYAIGIKEWMGLDVGGLEILRFGKEDGEFETMLVDDPKEIQIFKDQAIRCRDTHEFLKLESDPRWKYEPKK